MKNYQSKTNINFTPEYRAWRNMKQRCDNPKSSMWHIYGGRGIEYCERWKRFNNFISDMGLRNSPNLSLDRINSDGNYHPLNCRWATKKEQYANRRKWSTVKIKGETKTVEEWCNILKLSSTTIRKIAKKL